MCELALDLSGAQFSHPLIFGRVSHCHGAHNYDPGHFSTTWTLQGISHFISINLYHDSGWVGGLCQEHGVYDDI